MAARIVIVDYGIGNLWSVHSALGFIGADHVVSSDLATIASADALILPGVGSFRKAMAALRTTGIADALLEAVLVRQRKIMGICLGMQLFAESSTEDGISEGLGFIKGGVDRFLPEEVGLLKVPHIGFNHVTPPTHGDLFRGISSPTDYYFIHSYRMLPSCRSGHKALCKYGVEFLAAYECENIFATQFHPEKSQTNGLKLLRNFVQA